MMWTSCVQLITSVSSTLFISHSARQCVPPRSTVNRGVESAKSTRDRLRPLWKKFLLNQFHDVLPGSCIEQVHVTFMPFW